MKEYNTKKIKIDLKRIIMLAQMYIKKKGYTEAAKQTGIDIAILYKFANNNKYNRTISELDTIFNIYNILREKTNEK